MSRVTRSILLSVAVVLLALSAASPALAAAKRETREGKHVETVEVLYFHPRFRCVSCNAVEKYAKEVVEGEFAAEVKDGKVVFKSLEIDDPKNKKLVEELGVSGSSLYIVVSSGGKREHSEIKSVWLDWNNPKKCKETISKAIQDALEGRSASGALPLAGVPVVLAAFLLGLLTAISPCPLATNIAALSYVSKKLDNRRYTILAGALYTAGRMVAYTLVGILLILIGFSASRVSLFFQNYADWFLGPLLLFFGLVMLDVIKFSIFKGRITAAIQHKVGDWGLAGSFLLGLVLALAFCPYSAIIFFGMLIPIALDSGGGIILPAVYGFGTGLPVMIFAAALTLGVSEIGKHVARVQKFEKYFRWFAGVVFIGIGLYYLVILIKSFF